MSGFPGPVYGLEVPPGEVLIPASMDFPASVSSTTPAITPMRTEAIAHTFGIIQG